MIILFTHSSRSRTYTMKSRKCMFVYATILTILSSFNTGAVSSSVNYTDHTKSPDDTPIGLPSRAEEEIELVALKYSTHINSLANEKHTVPYAYLPASGTVLNTSVFYSSYFSYHHINSDPEGNSTDSNHYVNDMTPAAYIIPEDIVGYQGDLDIRNTKLPTNLSINDTPDSIGDSKDSVLSDEKSGEWCSKSDPVLRVVEMANREVGLVLSDAKPDTRYRAYRCDPPYGFSFSSENTTLDFEHSYEINFPGLRFPGNSLAVDNTVIPGRRYFYTFAELDFEGNAIVKCPKLKEITVSELPALCATQEDDYVRLNLSNPELQTQYRAVRFTLPAGCDASTGLKFSEMDGIEIISLQRVSMRLQTARDTFQFTPTVTYYYTFTPLDVDGKPVAGWEFPDPVSITLNFGEIINNQPSKPAPSDPNESIHVTFSGHDVDTYGMMLLYGKVLETQTIDEVITAKTVINGIHKQLVYSITCKSEHDLVTSAPAYELDITLVLLKNMLYECTVRCYHDLTTKFSRVTVTKPIDVFIQNDTTKNINISTTEWGPWTPCDRKIEKI
eukprot:522784_1